MALKPDRDYNAMDDISFFWTDTAATVEKGGCASLVTAGSGVSLDDTNNVVEYAADPSGAVPKGVMLADVAVYTPTTRFHRNFDNGEVLPGEKVCLIRKGWVVTDMITGTPTAGGDAYLGVSGYFATEMPSGSYSVVVGKFETTADPDGFVKVFVDL